MGLINYIGENLNNLSNFMTIEHLMEIRVRRVVPETPRILSERITHFFNDFWNQITNISQNFSFFSKTKNFYSENNFLNKIFIKKELILLEKNYLDFYPIKEQSYGRSITLEKIYEDGTIVMFVNDFYYNLFIPLELISIVNLENINNVDKFINNIYITNENSLIFFKNEIIITISIDSINSNNCNKALFLVLEENNIVNETPVILEENNIVNETPVILEENNIVNETPVILEENNKNYETFFFKGLENMRFLEIDKVINKQNFSFILSQFSCEFIINNYNKLLKFYDLIIDLYCLENQYNLKNFNFLMDIKNKNSIYLLEIYLNILKDPIFLLFFDNKNGFNYNQKQILFTNLGYFNFLIFDILDFLFSDSFRKFKDSGSDYIYLNALNLDKIASGFSISNIKFNSMTNIELFNSKEINYFVNAKNFDKDYIIFNDKNSFYSFINELLINTRDRKFLNDVSKTNLKFSENKFILGDSKSIKLNSYITNIEIKALNYKFNFYSIIFEKKISAFVHKSNLSPENKYLICLFKIIEAKTHFLFSNNVFLLMISDYLEEINPLIENHKLNQSNKFKFYTIIVEFFQKYVDSYLSFYGLDYGLDDDLDDDLNENLCNDE